MDFKLGIIIPTYNSFDTLKVLVGNIFDYTDGDYTVYIVEDGQKQETIDWLKTQNVKAIYHEKNKGVSPSWNDGLREAVKDGCTHFAILNDDIELPPKWWEECRKVFENNDVHLVSLTSPEHAGYNFGSLHITGWFFIIDKKCIDKVGYFDEQFAPFCAEDDDYFERYKQTRMPYARVNIDVFHHGSKTLKTLDGEIFKKVKRENWFKFRRKHPNKIMPAI